jgi:hypothetical protein
VQIGIDAVGCHTAQQIDLILIGHCDQQIRLLNIRGLQRVHGGTVAADDHDIKIVLNGIQNLGLMSITVRSCPSAASCLVGKSDFSVAGNNDLHANPLFC